MVGDEDPLLGRRQRQHVIRLRALVGGGRGCEQLGRAGDFGVAQAQRVESFRRVGLERQQLGDGARLAVAAGEHQLGAELPALVETLDLEGSDLHAPMDST